MSTEFRTDTLESEEPIPENELDSDSTMLIERRYRQPHPNDHCHRRSDCVHVGSPRPLHPVRTETPPSQTGHRLSTIHLFTSAIHAISPHATLHYLSSPGTTGHRRGIHPLAQPDKDRRRSWNRSALRLSSRSRPRPFRAPRHPLARRPRPYHRESRKRFGHVGRRRPRGSRPRAPLVNRTMG